jgi:hypothetical protein
MISNRCDNSIVTDRDAYLLVPEYAVLSRFAIIIFDEHMLLSVHSLLFEAKPDCQITFKSILTYLEPATLHDQLPLLTVQTK